jgi:hypothetical protein
MSIRIPWTILILGLTASPFAACGSGGETTSEAAGTSSGTGGTGGASTSSGGGAGGAGGATTSSSSAGTGGTGGATASSSSGGPASIDAKLVISELYVNCQPIVAEDPVLGTFTASYTNTGAAPQTATVTSAVLTFTSGPNSLAWSFPVQPPGSGPVQPNAPLQVTHTKQMKTGTIEGTPCSFCNGTWTLSVSWDVAGATVTDTLPSSPVSCVF